MAETAVSFVVQQLCQLLIKEGNLLRGVTKDFTDIKYELESIQAFLKDADRRATRDGSDNNEGIKTWVKQLREASFHIEDVIDEYIMYVAHRIINHHGCIALIKKIVHMIKNLKHRHRIASEIQGIKLSVNGIKERGKSFLPSLERTNDVQRHDPRVDSLFIEETEVVGFESPIVDLIGWLVEDRSNENIVVSVVGMGGVGKTTLAKQVFDNQKVNKHFDYRTFITVSQSYTVKRLFIDMIKKFCKETKEPLPECLHEMDENALRIEVRQRFQSKRYLVLFDDVWKEDFSDEIKHALPNNNRGSRIIVTTRMMKVAEFFKSSFTVHIHELQLLPPNKAWELFCKKAFRSEPGCICPTELEEISNEIVQKCGGLPLAIVAIGGLLSTKPKSMSEWGKVSENLRLELQHNAHLDGIKRILSLSYDDLPYNLKSCMLLKRSISK